jgi:hypothetical protein
MLQAPRSRVRVPMRLIFFNLPNPSSRTMALGSTQPLKEANTRNLPGGKGRPASKADNFSSPSVCRLSREKVGHSTSHNPVGLHGLLQGQFYLFYLAFSPSVSCIVLPLPKQQTRHYNPQTWLTSLINDCSPASELLIGNI